MLKTFIQSFRSHLAVSWWLEWAFNIREMLLTYVRWLAKPISNIIIRNCTSYLIKYWMVLLSIFSMLEDLITYIFNQRHPKQHFQSSIILHSDWLKQLVTWFASPNHNALFQTRIVMPLWNFFKTSAAGNGILNDLFVKQETPCSNLYSITLK